MSELVEAPPPALTSQGGSMSELVEAPPPALTSQGGSMSELVEAPPPALPTQRRPYLLPPNWRASVRWFAAEFAVVVAGILTALALQSWYTGRQERGLEVQYQESLVVDLNADLVQFDSTEAWMRRSEAAAATVLALYEGSPPTKNTADLVAAVETAGWQYVPSISRNTIDDLKSTGNLRLIRDPALRRAITSYYTTIDNVSVPLANTRDRIWAQYDARVENVLAPGQRLAVLQRPESFGRGISSDAIKAAKPLSVGELIAALRAFPELKIAAGEVLYQTINNRAGLAEMRRATLGLRAKLKQSLASRAQR